MSFLLTFDEAFDRVVELARPVRKETIPVASAYNRVLAVDAVAEISNPPFPRAMMDGFAIRAGQALPGTRLERLQQVIKLAVYMLQDGQAIRILTGAPMPDTADSVPDMNGARKWKDILNY